MKVFKRSKSEVISLTTGLRECLHLLRLWVQNMCRQTGKTHTSHTASITVASSDLGNIVTWFEKKSKKRKARRRRELGPDSSMLTWQSFSLMSLPATSVLLGTCWRNWLGRCDPHKGHDPERHCSRQWHSSWCTQNRDRRRWRLWKDIPANGVRQRRFPWGEILHRLLDSFFSVSRPDLLQFQRLESYRNNH